MTMRSNVVGERRDSPVTSAAVQCGLRGLLNDEQERALFGARSGPDD